MSRKKWTPFAVHRDDGGADEYFVDVRACGIPVWVVLCDGMTLHKFGTEARTYLKLDDAIQWFRTEEIKADRLTVVQRKAMNALITAKRKMADGHVNEQ